jgi:hypothetical protein
MCSSYNLLSTPAGSLRRMNRYAPTNADGDTKEIVKRFRLINKGGNDGLTSTTREKLYLIQKTLTTRYHRAAV